MHHEQVIELVSNLVRAASIKGTIHLRVIVNEYRLDCCDACEELFEAWDAISKAFNGKNNTIDYVVQLYSLLRSRGSDCQLSVTQDGIVTPIEKARLCLAMWISPHQLQQLDRFSQSVGKTRSEAAELLIASGLQIRALIGETGL